MSKNKYPWLKRLAFDTPPGDEPPTANPEGEDDKGREEIFDVPVPEPPAKKEMDDMRSDLINKYLEDLETAQKRGDTAGAEMAKKRMRELVSRLRKQLKVARLMVGAKYGPNEKFETYKPSKGGEMPNRGEFTGDMHPTDTGDPAQVELDHWKGGDQLYQKDKSREDTGVDYGSALQSRDAKRKDVKKHQAEKPEARPKLEWVGKKTRK